MFVFSLSSRGCGPDTRYFERLTRVFFFKARRFLPHKFSGVHLLKVTRSWKSFGRFVKLKPGSVRCFDFGVCVGGSSRHFGEHSARQAPMTSGLSMHISSALRSIVRVVR